MKIISLTIDGRVIQVSPGKSVLWAALDNGVYIPNLCAMRGAERPDASCRLCFVSIKGNSQPVTACTEPVQEGMVVSTRDPASLRLVRSGFELIMASHPVDCAHCPANRHSCELQKIARHLGSSLKSRRLSSLIKELPVDDTSPLFIYNPNRCVLCGRCILVCRSQATGAIGFIRRGFERKVGTFNDGPLGRSGCSDCGECVRVCPAGALAFKRG